LHFRQSIERSAFPSVDSVRWAIEPGRPRIVYSPDDTIGADTRPEDLARVLIVEDDFLVASETELALSEAGFTIVGIVATAEEAIEKAAAEKVALVVMDVRLSGERDGVDAAIELFQRLGIRSIFASAYSSPDIRKRAEEAMPHGWLQKPYSKTSLVAAVRAALESPGRKH
jgi:DNA-binding NarL/FixJ family response regulator